MKLSARNQFKGTVVKIEEGVVTALVVSDIGNGNKITSTISLDALKDLGIKVGSIFCGVLTPERLSITHTAKTSLI